MNGCLPFLFALQISIFASLIPAISSADDRVVASAVENLDQTISQRITRVPEFEFIRKQAEKLGVRAWLFGGTASGFGHYVKWDLQRESGDPRFQKDRFDYDYSNIYRSTQDLDIVVDGTPEKAEEFQRILKETYPHAQGSKSAWEVRLLRRTVGDKEALLDNPDFLNQHTDSNSTGMIEITRPPRGEAAIRDLRDWNSKNPAFLKDLKESKLHFYFSPSHLTTSRAKQGLNPPIISVLRYLTKAFQYELEIDPKSLAQIQKIIAEFDPTRDLLSDYAKHTLEKNGKKMIQHAVNLEYARESLDRLGLREKLIQLGDPTESESLAWWLNKEPLRKKPLGNGKGKTAAEIFSAKGWEKGPQGELIVAHETNNFLAYESITRAHTGDPNVLISRDGFEGETAAHGDGFYTQVGREGARGTGLTIRFAVDPQARLGADFTVDGNYLVIKNKNAIRVIPESLNLDPPAYFRFLADAEKIDDSDRALLEKLGRKTRNRLGVLSEKERLEIQKIILESFKKNGLKNKALFSEWLRIPESVELSRDILQVVEKKPASLLQWVAWTQKSPHWQAHPIVADFTLKRFLEAEIAAKSEDAYVDYEIERDLRARFMDRKRIPSADVDAATRFLIESLRSDTIKAAPLKAALRQWLDLPWTWQIEAVTDEAAKTPRGGSFVLMEAIQRGRLEYVKKHPDFPTSKDDIRVAKAVRDSGDKSSFDLLEFLVDNNSNTNADDRIAEKLGRHVSHPRWEALVAKLIQRKSADREITRSLLDYKKAAAHPEWVETFIARGNRDDNLVSSVLNRPEIWKPRPEWMTALLASTRESGDWNVDRNFVYALQDPKWKKFPQWRSWVETLLDAKTPPENILERDVIRPSDIDLLIEKKKGYLNNAIITSLMKKPNASDPAEYRDPAWIRERFEKIVRQGNADAKLVTDVLSKPKWAHETGWVDEIVGRVGKTAKVEDDAGTEIAQHLLTKPYSAQHPRWLLTLLKNGRVDEELGAFEAVLNQSVLSARHWKNHPELKKLFGENYSSLKANDLRILSRDRGDLKVIIEIMLEQMRGISNMFTGELDHARMQGLLSKFDPEEVAALAQMAIPESHDYSDHIEIIRREAQRAVKKRNDLRWVDWLEEDLKKDNSDGRHRIQILEAVGVQDKLALSAVLKQWEQIKSADTDEKKLLAFYLVLELEKSVQEGDVHVVPIALDRMLHSDDHRVRVNSLRILKKTRPPLEQVRSALWSLLKNESYALRMLSIEALSELGERSPEFAALLKDILEKDNAHVKWEAKRALAAIQEGVGSVAAELQKALGVGQ